MDDIRTLVTSEASLEAQVVLVHEFANTNFLKLNLSKCEIVVYCNKGKVVLTQFGYFSFLPLLHH